MRRVTKRGPDVAAAPSGSEAAAEPPVWVTAALAAACVAFALAKPLSDLSFFLESPLRFADTGRPMLVGADSYHFLRLTAEGAGPALSQTLALVRALTGLPLDTVALWLSPVASLSLVWPVWAWGRRLGGPQAGAAAALAAVCAPYWVEVTALGKCQTPCLVPALLLGCALGLDRLREAGPRLCAFALTLACAGLLAWWWRPGGYLCAALAGLALVAPGRPLGRLSPYVRAGLLVCAGATALLFWSGAWRQLPVPLADLFSYAWRHVGLALRTNPDQSAMAASIIELAPLSPGDLALLAAGSWPGLLAGLAGLALGFARRPQALWTLGPILAAGMLGLRTQRMTLFLFPLTALGLGVLAALTTGAVLQRVERPFARRPAARSLIAFVLAGLVALPAIVRDFSLKPEGVVDGRTDALLLATIPAMPPNATLWSWWDYGYYLAWRTGRAPFFDGGSQTAGDAFAAAFPLVCPDPDIAADWMRFFAARGQGEFDRLAARTGSRERAFELLVRLFAGREDPAALFAALGGADLTDPQGYFFPDAPVVLVLPWDIWLRNAHWVAFGSSPLSPAGTPANNVEVFSTRGLTCDATTGRVSLPDQARAKGYDRIGSALDLSEGLPAFRELQALPDPLLLYHLPTDLAFVANRTMAQSLAFALLAPTGFTHPRFEPLGYEPGVGGVWLVQGRDARP